MILSTLFALALVAATPPVVDRDDSTAIWGSTHSDSYHTARCHILARITPDYRRRFDDLQQAIRSGYQPCKICHPPTRVVTANPSAPDRVGIATSGEESDTLFAVLIASRLSQLGRAEGTVFPADATRGTVYALSLTATLTPEQRAYALHEFACGLAQMPAAMVAQAHFAVLNKSGDVQLRAHFDGRVDTLLSPLALIDTMRAHGAIEDR